MPVTKRKVLKITGWILLGVVEVAAIVGGYAYYNRERLLKTALDRGIRKAKRDYNLDVKIGSARFTGLTSVAFTKISVVPEDRDSLARIDRVEVGVKLLPLLVGQIGLSDMTLENGLVQVVKRDSLTNVDFLIRRRKKDSTTTVTTDAPKRLNLADVSESLVDNLLSKIPDNLHVTNLELRGIDSTRRITLLAEKATIDDEVVSSTLRINGTEATWHVAGTADPSDREYNLKLFADNKPLELPYLFDRFKLKLQVDTVGIELRDVGRSVGDFHLEGAGSVRNLRVNHPALSPTDVSVDRASMDANLFVGENYVGIDSTSTIHLGEVSARPYVKYTLSPSKIYDVQLHTDSLDAQALFNAFPRGLFESLEGIKVAGKLKYDMALHLDTALPDSVKFGSGLTASPDFRINRLGNVDFSRINQPFVYTPYEKGKPVRDITVGPANPDYTPLNQISPNLRNALLTSEDYTFFTHNGFNEKAFRVSIATNYKAGSFKRGASTISMQLVKNAYLNRKKNIARKIEEILIVWLIENEDIVSKERLYEVYLNIIEWGRNIYGIGEASRYYFDKSPANLTIGESIFLAFVVPKPKSTLNHFNPDGSVRTYVRGYFKLIGRIMARRGLTAPDSSAYGFYGVRLRSALRQQIAPNDSMSSDSLMVDPANVDDVDDFLKQLFEDRQEERPDRSERPRQNAESDKPADESKLESTVEVDTTQTDKPETRRERKRREREERKRKQEEGIEEL